MVQRHVFRQIFIHIKKKFRTHVIVSSKPLEAKYGGHMPGMPSLRRSRQEDSKGELHSEILHSHTRKMMKLGPERWPGAKVLAT